MDVVPYKIGVPTMKLAIRGSGETMLFIDRSSYTWMLCSTKSVSPVAAFRN